MIQVFQGSIFDTECDLLIIPCNNMGGMRRSIQNEIIKNELPILRKTVKVGEVYYLQNYGQSTNALTIGYASVLDTYTKTSNENILRNILKSIKSYCHEWSLRKINIPLLGTGSGKLSAEKSYDIMKMEFENESNLSLNIYVISYNMYTQLSTDKKKQTVLKNPRVFISYASDNERNKKWVEEFAYELRACGVNARLDELNLRAGEILKQWMAKEIREADKVLIVSDKFYAQKANEGIGGVGFETKVIQGELAERKQEKKYIIIARELDINLALPFYLKDRYAISMVGDCIDKKKFETVLINIFDYNKIPSIGPTPDFSKFN